MSDAQVQPDRRAALVLHGLAPRDRQAVLSRLEASARSRVVALLAELNQLGLPSQPALAQLTLATIHAPSNRQPTLATATGAEVDLALRGETDGLVARVLAADPWPWEQAFLLRQPLVRQRRLREAVDRLRRGRQEGHGHLLRAALIREVELRLKDRSEDELAEPQSWRQRGAIVWRLVGRWAMHVRSRGAA